MLTAEEFAVQAERFSASSAGLNPSWVWVAGGSDMPSRFATCPATGYLRASPLLVLAQDCPPSEARAAPSISVEAATGDEDDAAALSPLVQHGRLDLHIIHSTSYRVPVLLLQGHHPDGTPWTPDALRAHLAAQPQRLRGGAAVAPLSGSVISQLDHPVLRVPCCCVDPCETAALMATLLGASNGSGEDGAPPLDYLSAWWSVVAPLVGAPYHAHVCVGMNREPTA
jgi:ubiquitin-like-conjugating enzyme ATG10